MADAQVSESLDLIERTRNLLQQDCDEKTCKRIIREWIDRVAKHRRQSGGKINFSDIEIAYLLVSLARLCPKKPIPANDMDIFVNNDDSESYDTETQWLLFLVLVRLLNEPAFKVSAKAEECLSVIIESLLHTEHGGVYCPLCNRYFVHECPGSSSIILDNSAGFSEDGDATVKKVAYYAIEAAPDEIENTIAMDFHEEQPQTIKIGVFRTGYASFTDSSVFSWHKLEEIDGKITPVVVDEDMERIQKSGIPFQDICDFCIFDRLERGSIQLIEHASPTFPVSSSMLPNAKHEMLKLWKEESLARTEQKVLYRSPVQRSWQKLI